MKRNPRFAGLCSLIAPIFSLVALGSIFELPGKAHATLSITDQAANVPTTSTWGLIAFGAAALVAYNRRGHLNRRG